MNQANYYTGSGYSVTQSTVYDVTQNYLTDVGAFSNSDSYYGTFDQTGNVVQWLSMDEEYRPFLVDGDAFAAGSDWRSDSFVGSQEVWFIYNTKYQLPDLGFRLASPAAVPEIDPSNFGSALALVAGVLALLERRRSR